MAPINGLYGIESAEDGSISVWNSGDLFGAIDVALFILVIGGFLGVTMSTGAIQAGIARIVDRLRGRESWLIPILMVVFAIGGTTFGMAEESLAFYALIVTVMIAAGYDSLVGASILLLGCGIGVLASTINPFATGIASGFAGTSLDEGLIGRLVILIVGIAIGIIFVMRYAARVKADPSRSLVFDMKESNEQHFHAQEDGASGEAKMTGAQKAVLTVFILAFAVMIYGVIPWEDLGIGLPTLWWWFPEMTASFLFFSILIGIVGRMSESSFTSTFVDGCRDLLGVALIIGIARGITVIMTNGLITDTVLSWAEQAVAGLGGAAFVNLMYLLFLPLSFLIPSTSGLATVAMPIMAPLAGFADVPPELVVTAYQSASGLINLVTPTSAVVMGGLAIARVGYGTWLKFVWPVLHPAGNTYDGRADRLHLRSMSSSEGVSVTDEKPTAATSDLAWHALTTDEALERQKVTPEAGLSAAEVTRRQSEYGLNKFADAPKEPRWRAFLRQYTDPMQIVLLIAGIVSLFIPSQFATGVLLIGLTLFNAALGLSQEGKASASVAALQTMMVVKTKARRDGSLVEVPMEQLVPGDIVNIEAGDLVPADSRVLTSATLEIDESALTGESVPVPKQVAPVAADSALGDRVDLAFMNTQVTRGAGTILVVKTGMETEVGHISGMLQVAKDEVTPLTKQLNSLTNQILIIAGVSLAGIDRYRAVARHAILRAVPDGSGIFGVRDSDRSAGRCHRRPCERHPDAGRGRRHREAAPFGRNARLDKCHQLGQDWHADAQPDDRRADGRRGPAIRDHG